MLGMVTVGALMVLSMNVSGTNILKVSEGSRRDSGVIWAFGGYYLYN